jgi:hypothetical protein
MELVDSCRFSSVLAANLLGAWDQIKVGSNDAMRSAVARSAKVDESHPLRQTHFDRHGSMRLGI